MANLDLSKYGIKDVKEILHNPSYDVLFAEETKADLEGYEKGQVTELGYSKRNDWYLHRTFSQR